MISQGAMWCTGLNQDSCMLTYYLTTAATTWLNILFSTLQPVCHHEICLALSVINGTWKVKPKLFKNSTAQKLISEKSIPNQQQQPKMHMINRNKRQQHSLVIVEQWIGDITKQAGIFWRKEAAGDLVNALLQLCIVLVVVTRVVSTHHWKLLISSYVSFRHITNNANKTLQLVTQCLRMINHIYETATIQQNAPDNITDVGLVTMFNCLGPMQCIGDNLIKMVYLLILLRRIHFTSQFTTGHSRYFARKHTSRCSAYYMGVVPAVKAWIQK